MRPRRAWQRGRGSGGRGSGGRGGGGRGSGGRVAGVAARGAPLSWYLEPSAVLRLVREHGVRGAGDRPVRASAHGARVRERPRRMASYVLGWVSGWARTARVGRIRLHVSLCLRALVREGVPGAPCARGGATASSS